MGDFLPLDAARIALVDKDLGTVDEGKLADLIVVRGDPLTDLRAAADVRLVVKNGRVYTQDEILAPARTRRKWAGTRIENRGPGASMGAPGPA
ncbi:hypothetical protein ACHAC9_01885 [Massilia sp. CMS3.1]|uniref:hypothetical protein n=1 Tax=Massilia sp. CMS3.1 TaxID=3373083 RepID=UPI003EE7BD75